MPLTRLPEPPPGLQARCDAVVDQLVADLAGVQAVYAAAHGGRLWQGIISHPIPPADGQETVPDLSRRPTDQAEDWNAVGLVLSDTTPCAVRVDVYQTPAGAWGYVVSGELVVAGKVYRRSVNVGPESYRDSGRGWVELTPLVGAPGAVPVRIVLVPVAVPPVVVAPPLETEAPLPPSPAATAPPPSAAELTGVGLTTAFLPKRGRRAWWLLVPAGLLAAGAAAAGLGGVEWIEQFLKSLGLI